MEDGLEGVGEEVGREAGSGLERASPENLQKAFAFWEGLGCFLYNVGQARPSWEHLCP